VKVNRFLPSPEPTLVSRLEEVVPSKVETLEDISDHDLTLGVRAREQLSIGCE